MAFDYQVKVGLGKNTMSVLFDLTSLCGSISSSVVSYLAFAKTHTCLCMTLGG